MKIDTSPVSEEFENHLKYAGERVLFSGKFGVGKTTFLQEYFQDNPDYISIHLFPVNYSVASNEDIFQLIKFDILFELLKPEYELTFDKIEFDDLLLATYFTKKKFLEVISTFLMILPRVGKKASDLVKSISKLSSEFKGFKSEAETDELKEVATFLETFRTTEGSLYEHDLHTALIENFLFQIKARTRKEIVLVIDDLERVDPEHLFRLLNVFSAHVDNGLGENKFGFNRVLFVLDIDNTSKIFHHKYGGETDFGGYIDKFYSRGIFNFDSSKFLSEEFERFFDALDLQDSNQSDQKKVFDSLRESEGFLKEVSIHILKSMILSSTLNLRKVSKKFDFNYLLPIYQLDFHGKKIWNSKFQVIILLDFLEFFFDSKNELIYSISKTELRPFNSYSGNFEELLVTTIGVLDYSNHQFTSTGEYEFETSGRKMKYVFNRRGVAYDFRLVSEIKQFPLNELLVELIDLLKLSRA